MTEEVCGRQQDLREASAHVEAERERQRLLLPAKVKGGTLEGSLVKVGVSARREIGLVAVGLAAPPLLPERGEGKGRGCRGRCVSVSLASLP